MLMMERGTIEKWLKDCEGFCHAFMTYSFEWHHAVGADLDLLRIEIEDAHADWVSIVHEWQTQRFKQETENLSYTKIVAVLLWTLSRKSFVGDMRKYESFRHAPPAFSGTEEQKLAILDDLLGAPEAVTALQFCLAILNFYEERRIDKKTPFQFRMTESSRHDLLVMITSKDESAISVYIALEAFYSRD